MDREFIAAARDALPRLIAEVEQLRAALMWIGSFTLEPEVCAKVVEVLPDAKKE